MKTLSFIYIVLIAVTGCSETDQAAATQGPAGDPASAANAPQDSGNDGRRQSPPQALAELGPIYISANLDNGRRLWDRCSTCHSLDGSRPPLPGPDLHGVLGAQVGARPGFTYSDALRDADFIWTADRLDAWLASPDSFLEGNAMSFAGVSDPDDRRDLIACIALEQACLDGAP